MMKKKLFLCCLLLCSISMFGQHRSKQEAIQIAQDFFNPRPTTLKARLSVVPQHQVLNKQTQVVNSSRAVATPSSSCYIINDEANNRFVIVSADERFYKILGYSNNGIFDPENAPVGLLELLDGYDAQYEYLLEHAPTAPLLDVRKYNFPVVEPLIKSKWNQNAPYWNQCPYDYSQTSSHPCYTGCVATALAQVMYYYKYPDDAQGYYSYTTSFGSTLTIDYDTVHFNWDKMCDTYVYYYDDNGERLRVPERTAEENEEVAKLMKACGVSVAMKYGTGGSSAYSQDLVASLVKYFKYNPNILYKRKEDFSAEVWDQMILKDLQEGHPILYCGSEGGWTGHQFILDGCDENGLYHFNFGWSGNDDGYYSLTGTDAIDYKYNQAMVYQITPEEYGTHEDYYSTRFVLNKRKISLGEKSGFSFNARYSRPNVKTNAILFSGSIGLALYDIDINFIDTLYTEEILQDSSSINMWNKSVKFDNRQLKNGSNYIVAPYSKGINAQQPSLITSEDGKPTYYLAKVLNDSITLCPQGLEIPEVAGTYMVSANNSEGQSKEWCVKIEKSQDDSDYDYIVLNIDPAAADDTKDDMCKVTASLSLDGSQLTLSEYIYGGKGRLINYSNEKGDLNLRINSQEKSLTFDDAWGTIMEKDSIVVSRYEDTRFTSIPLNELTLTVVNNKAGDLETQIPLRTKSFINSLSVSGAVNSSDIKLIRNLLIFGSLETLDLENAMIVEGGEPYEDNYVTENNVIGEYMFYCCDNLKTILLPSNLVAIRDDAFYSCKKLESIIIPEGIKELPGFSLSYCNKLSRLSIPSSIEIINNYSLYKSNYLRRIDCHLRNIGKVKSSIYSSAKEGELEAFKDVRNDCEWHVPNGLTQQYSSQSWWNPSWTIIDDLILSLLMGDSNDDGEIDVADVMSIAHYILLQPLPTFMFDASDMDHDGMVDVADLMQVIQLIMQQSSASSTRMSARGVNSLSRLLLNPTKDYSVLSVSNDDDYVAAQFDVCLPQGTDIRTVYSKNDDASIHFDRLDNRTYRVVMFSVDGRPLVGMDNELLTLTFTSENVIPDISNVLFVTNRDEKHNLALDYGHFTQVIAPETRQTVRAYTIDGRRVVTGSANKLNKGVYIVNGKKYIVK